MSHTMVLYLLLLACLTVTSQSASLLFESFQVNSHMNQNDVKETKRPVYFALDGKTWPYSFINEYGDLDGFDLEMVKAVCQQAGRRCEAILAEPQQCIYTERDNATGVPMQDMDYSGKGLLGRVFDACPHHERTTDRLTVADFTLPYLTTSCSYAVAPHNPSGFDPFNKDFSKFRIVHVNGHSANRQCLKRQRKSYMAENLKIAADIHEAREMVIKGEADVVFSSISSLRGLTVVKSDVNCGGQVGVMVRQGSPIASWWNSAFRKLYKSGRYNKLCAASERKYGEHLKCLPSPDEADEELLAAMTEMPDKKHDSDRLYVFMASGRSAAYSYLDEDGKLQGFTKDLIDEVCSRAGKRCRFSLTSNKECIHRVGETYYPGRGVQSGWFDVCTGYYNTPERRNSYDFTSAYLDNYAHYQVAPGNPANFHPNMKDTSGLVVVHKENAETNDHCLNRLGLKVKRVFSVETRQDAVDAVLSGEADVYFTTRLSMAEELQSVGDKVHCDRGGTCMMLPKGSEVPSWWDPAMARFYNSGEYSKWCREASGKFKFEFPCLPHPRS